MTTLTVVVAAAAVVVGANDQLYINISPSIYQYHAYILNYTHAHTYDEDLII